MRLLALLLLLPSLALAQAPFWRTHADDIEVAQFEPSTRGLLPASALFVRSSLKRYRLTVLRAREFGWEGAAVKSLAKASGAAVAVNANFFDEAGKPLGLVVARGTIFQQPHRGGSTLTGMLQSRAGILSIVNRSNYIPEGVAEAVQAGPRLIVNRKPVPGIRDVTSSSRRAGVCLDPQGRLIVFAVSSPLGGISINELQELLLRPEIACADALNLDGGGSAQIFVSASLPGVAGSGIELSIPGIDDIPVALALLPRE